ncbi:TolC family protein [Nitratireductor sp. CAU 1489]|uniref:TolC family protein n=1 Tax=Nitratireductor arenosus TaxID=2682096 RepID=A0A844QJX4_9HYPH|nr:TolC family protein [Nitratireductor arenosus]MVA97989.1 TolC family protein [Nitratireductor arenosus]
MRTGIPRIIALAALPLLTAGCATTGAVDTNPLNAFAPVSDRTASVTGKQTVWLQSAEEARKAGERVQALVRNRTVGPDTAVQVALLNNKGLQAAYADIGMSAADVWQETMLVNPPISIGVIGVDPVRTVEAAVVTNILALITRPRRVAIAEARFRQAQLRAAEETLRLAADTRRAWIEAVAAWERVAYLNRAQAAADAASALAQKLGETGAFTKTGQAREHVFYAELAGQTAEARMQARMAKEALTRLMGLWGYDVDYQVPDALPALPKGTKAKRAIETEALKNRVDLEIARLELQALARSYGLTSATRYVSDLGLRSGVEIEREEEEDGSTRTEVIGIAEIDFVIPIFDTGKARMRKAELAYMQAANLLAERAVNIRSEARGAYDAYRSTYDIARHYRNNVIPLRTTIEEESLLTYNGMITNTFELLADTRAKIDSIMLSLNAKRQFWLADVDLGTAIHGGGSGSSPAMATEVAAAGDGGGGH